MRAIVLSTLTLALAASSPVLAQNRDENGASDRAAPERSTDDPARDRLPDRESASEPEMRATADKDDGTAVYVVKKGDTLSEIARQELGDATQWKAIAELNSIEEPKQLAVGKRLQMPGAGAQTDGADRQSEDDGSIFGR